MIKEGNVDKNVECGKLFYFEGKNSLESEKIAPFLESFPHYQHLKCGKLFSFYLQFTELYNFRKVKR